METILIVDDEKNYLVVLEALLGPEGYEILTTDNAPDALRQVREADLDLIITDMKMPRMNGMELLEEAKSIKPDLPVIIMTAYGTIELAVEAMKKHAYDYITKPFQNEQLKLTVKKALENYRLIKENRLLNEALSDRFKYGNIIGKSKPMLKVYDLIEKVAQSKASILITGPSGTGKELIAKAIHYDSPRKDRPFVSINCGALTETLLESELFGHEKGAGTRTIKVDVRIISASNRNIKDDVAEDSFREDLFYRLNVIHIEVSPLHERTDDIPLLVNHFIEKHRDDEGKNKIELSPDVWKALYSYSWPGNVRELENIIERAVVLNSGDMITLEDFPEELTEAQAEFDVDRFIPSNVCLTDALERIEEKMIRRSLAQCDNIQAHAAKNLGITKSLIQHKMKKYKIVV
jgi:two-component system NtrC family response regulator